MKKQLSTYPLRLPASLKTAVAEISKADGTSINQFVATAVAEKISALRTAEFFAGRTARGGSRGGAAAAAPAGRPDSGTRRPARTGGSAQGRAGRRERRR